MAAFFDPETKHQNAQRAFKLRKRKGEGGTLSPQEGAWLRNYEAVTPKRGRRGRAEPRRAEKAKTEPDLASAARAGAAEAAAGGEEAAGEESIPGLDAEGFIKCVVTASERDESGDGASSEGGAQTDHSGYAMDPHTILRLVAVGIIEIAKTLR